MFHIWGESCMCTVCLVKLTFCCLSIAGAGIMATRLVFLSLVCGAVSVSVGEHLTTSEGEFVKLNNFL